MDVYNADLKSTKNSSNVFKHIGTSPITAADRVEGMFAHQKSSMITREGAVILLDEKGLPNGKISLSQHLNDFCNFAERFLIKQYYLSVSRALKLNDLWEDDPIGSAGPGVVDIYTLNSVQQKAIQSLFAPFTDVIYPTDVFAVKSKRDIKLIRQRYVRNGIFLEELKKRKLRSKAIGEDFRQAQYQELVWLDLTFKFRQWAIENGYDTFVYSNSKEGDGSNNYVTLFPNQLKDTGKRFSFLREKYMDEMPSILSNYVMSNTSGQSRVVFHTLWGKQDPMRYWRDK